MIQFWIPALSTLKCRKGGAIRVAWLGGHCADPYRMGGDRRARWQDWRAWVTQYVMMYCPRRPPIPSRGWCVTTQAHLPSSVHPDAENIHKAIVDCLVARKGKSSTGTGFFAEDKDLSGLFFAVDHESGKAGVAVTIKEIGHATV